MWIIQFKEVDSNKWLNHTAKVFTDFALAKAFVESKRRRYGSGFDYRLVECKVLED